MKKAIPSTRPTNVGRLLGVGEQHAFGMEPMWAMPNLPTHPPRNRAHFRPFLNGQHLSPPLDDPLLALERVVFGVDPDFGVVPQEL